MGKTLRKEGVLQKNWDAIISCCISKAFAFDHLPLSPCPRTTMQSASSVREDDISTADVIMLDGSMAASSGCSAWQNTVLLLAQLAKSEPVFLALLASGLDRVVAAPRHGTTTWSLMSDAASYSDSNGKRSGTAVATAVLEMLARAATDLTVSKACMDACLLPPSSTVDRADTLLRPLLLPVLLQFACCGSASAPGLPAATLKTLTMCCDTVLRAVAAGGSDSTQVCLRCVVRLSQSDFIYVLVYFQLMLQKVFCAVLCLSADDGPLCTRITVLARLVTACVPRTFGRRESTVCSPRRSNGAHPTGPPYRRRWRG
jgi:hypothetical protein